VESEPEASHNARSGALTCSHCPRHNAGLVSLSGTLRTLQILDLRLMGRAFERRPVEHEP
jgi:hypothetical protein